jgi:YidC/Oxa1 family membrane protein insertase
MSALSVLDPAARPLHDLLTSVAAALPGPPVAQLVQALVLLTLLIRVALLPLAVRAHRASSARAALAPEIALLRAKHGKDRERLSQELLAAHRRAGISPLAGLGPVLLQAPVVMTLYRAVTLIGAPLSAHWLPTVAAAGFVSTPGLLLVVLLLTLSALATLSARQVKEGPAVLRVLPYGTVAFAAVAPLAVSVYLLSTTAWSVAERAVLPHLG